MKPCMNQLTTKTTPFEKDLEIYAKAGFKAVELFYPKLEAYCETHSYQQARQLLRDYELEIAGSCGGVMGMLLCQDDEKQSRHKFLRKRLEQCQKIGAPVLLSVNSTLKGAFPDVTFAKKSATGVFSEGSITETVHV